MAQWAREHGRPAGRGTDTLPGEPVAVRTAPDLGRRARGARGAAPPRERRSHRASSATLLEALGRQAAVALDRVRLAEEARRAALRAKTEELRSGLLSAGLARPPDAARRDHRRGDACSSTRASPTPRSAAS